MTRIEQRKRDGLPINLPELTAQYLADWWLEIGPSEGEGPISWQALESWQRQMGTELEPWEGIAIRAMSKAFLNSRYEARKRNCPAPYRISAPTDQEQGEAGIAALFAGLDQLAKSKRR